MVPDIESWMGDRFCALTDDMLTDMTVPSKGAATNTFKRRGVAFNFAAEAQPETFRKHMQRRFFSASFSVDYMLYSDLRPAPQKHK